MDIGSEVGFLLNPLCTKSHFIIKLTLNKRDFTLEEE